MDGKEPMPHWDMRLGKDRIVANGELLTARAALPEPEANVTFFVLDAIEPISAALGFAMRAHNAVRPHKAFDEFDCLGFIGKQRSKIFERHGTSFSKGS